MKVEFHCHRFCALAHTQFVFGFVLLFARFFPSVFYTSSKWIGWAHVCMHCRHIISSIKYLGMFSHCSDHFFVFYFFVTRSSCARIAWCNIIMNFQSVVHTAICVLYVNGERYAVCLASMHSFYRIKHTRSSICRNFPWNVRFSLPTCSLAPMTKKSFYVSSFSVKFNLYSSKCASLHSVGSFTISLSLLLSLFYSAV